MRALFRERGRHPQGALPLLTWLAPFLSSCLSSSCWTNDRVRETLLVRQRPQKSRQRLVLERHPCPEQPPPSECPSQPGWVSAASETRVLPVPSFVQAPARQQGRGSLLPDASTSCRHTSECSNHVSQGSSVSRAASGPVGLPACFCSRAGRGRAPARVPGGHRVFSFKGFDVWFPRPSLEV